MKFRIIKKIYNGESSYFIEQRFLLFFWSILCGPSEWPIKFKTLHECEDYIYKIAQESIEIAIPVCSTKHFNN